MSKKTVITVTLKDGRSYGCVSLHSCIAITENREQEELEFVPGLSIVCSGSVEIFPISEIKSIEIGSDSLCYLCDERIKGEKN